MSLFGNPELRSKNQTLQTKNCAYPNCGKEYLGRGKSRYCEEHRKPEYKLEKYKRIKKEDHNNTQIKHNNKTSLKLIKTCELEGCKNTFDLVLIPNQFIYPKYCPQHRNEFQRQNYLRIKNEKK